MVWLPHRDDALALQLDDIASSLDAGLSAEEVLRGPSCARLAGPVDLTTGFVAGLVTRGATLEPTERLILAAGETGGNLPHALRSCAAGRRRRAELIRSLVKGIAYPAVVLLMSLGVVVMMVALFGGAWRLAVWATVPAAIIASLLVLRRLAQRPDFTGGRIPMLSGLLADLGELPYLEALAGLYGAGVGIVEAHGQALRTVPVAAVRARLFRAEQQLEAGGGEVTEALARSGAVSAETLSILAPAERAGTLEEALERAAERRRFTLEARATRAVRVIGTVMYGLAVLYVVWLVLDFYGGLYGSLRR